MRQDHHSASNSLPKGDRATVIRHNVVVGVVKFLQVPLSEVGLGSYADTRPCVIHQFTQQNTLIFLPQSIDIDTDHLEVHSVYPLTAREGMEFLSIALAFQFL